MAMIGLVKRREVWFPTLRGWVLLGLASLALVVGGIGGAVPFLSPNRPLHHGILVVEGWLPDYALEEAKRTFESHSYRLLVVTGVPIDHGFLVSSYKDFAQLAAATLKEAGLKEELIVPVVCPEVPKDRTYATARKFRTWLKSAQAGESVDVFTLGVHARRTWLIYRLALGSEHPMGIISGHDRRYDARRWWRTSSGFRTVTGEIIAYFYAKLLFQPNAPEAS